MLSKKNVYVLTLFLNYKQSIDALTVTKQKSRNNIIFKLQTIHVVTKQKMIPTYFKATPARAQRQ